MWRTLHYNTINNITVNTCFLTSIHAYNYSRFTKLHTCKWCMQCTTVIIIRKWDTRERETHSHRERERERERETCCCVVVVFPSTFMPGHGPSRHKVYQDQDQTKMRVRDWSRVITQIMHTHTHTSSTTILPPSILPFCALLLGTAAGLAKNLTEWAAWLDLWQCHVFDTFEVRIAANSVLLFVGSDRCFC